MEGWTAFASILRKSLERARIVLSTKYWVLVPCFSGSLPQDSCGDAREEYIDFANSRLTPDFSAMSRPDVITDHSEISIPISTVEYDAGEILETRNTLELGTSTLTWTG